MSKYFIVSMNSISQYESYEEAVTALKSSGDNTAVLASAESLETLLRVYPEFSRELMPNVVWYKRKT